MRASEFEFRHRSWVFFLIFLLGFSCYAFQQVNAVEWLLQALGISGPIAGTYPQEPAGHAIFMVGAVSVGLAALIRTWGTAYLRAEVMRDRVLHTERLVADGPYRHVRNPLYLGSLMMAAGVGLLASPIGWLVLMAGFVVALLRLIGREEAFLLEKQGEAYQAYLKRVHRLWPSLRPRVPAGGAAPRWGQALAGEMWMWFLFAGSALFAATLSMRAFGYIVWGGLILSMAVRITMKRRLGRRRTQSIS
jgi:protein-S-isoprenylcysteine O-methyltransferase Ste14